MDTIQILMFCIVAAIYVATMATAITITTIGFVNMMRRKN